MKHFIQKIKQSTEWEILGEMTKPRIILMAALFNVAAYISMYGILELMLFLYYNL